VDEMYRKGTFHEFSKTKLCTSKVTIEAFYSSTDAQVNGLKNNFKIYIKIYIKTAPRSALFELAKVTVVKIIN
jgi:hypothetical protein